MGRASITADDDHDVANADSSGCTKVDAETPLTLRAVLPRNVLASVEGVNVETEPGLAAILDERRGDERAWWPWTLAAVAAIALSAVVFRTARSRLPLRR